MYVLGSAKVSNITQAPFWAWWGSEMNKNSSTAKSGAREFLSRFHGNAKGFKLPKFEMPGKYTPVMKINK